jgi:predicted Zn-dependent peptidase
MLEYKKITLSNGLRFLYHEDRTTPMVALNVLYDVGARDEDKNRTGFAHLFEHLMFGGSINIPEYDTPLQMAGGENNAYTTNDITNYYIQLPAENIETAFWLESDRMLSLAFSEKSLDVQRKVVCEEFKEHYINKPYGDVWKHLRALAYQQHPYQWMTIGKELAHIEEAQLEDVKAFFKKHYNPQNAVVCVAGNCSFEEVIALAKKWFEPIPAGEKYIRNIAPEPAQTAARHLEVHADVPSDALYMAWHIAPRLDPSYYATDIITEIMGHGNASRLYQKLVKEQQLFSSIQCYHTGSVEAGLLVIDGKIRNDQKIEDACKAVEHEIELLLKEGISDFELSKSKNKLEAMIVFEDMQILSRANNLAFYELLGDAEKINQEWDHYNAVKKDELMQVAHSIFRPNNKNTLFYKRK